MIKNDNTVAYRRKPALVTSNYVKLKLSLVVIFGLWVNSLPLPDANIDTVIQ